jgi:hypothetical protein
MLLDSYIYCLQSGGHRRYYNSHNILTIDAVSNNHLEESRSAYRILYSNLVLCAQLREHPAIIIPLSQGIDPNVGPNADDTKRIEY